jgi:predicted deacylase
MAEGMLDWILSEQPAARELLRRSVVYLVPFMNPDGVLLGNYRVNRVGVNLNRVWNDPDPSYAPSVAAVVREMESFVAGGGDITIFVDYHAHSSRRKNFFFYNGSDITDPQMGAEIEAFMAVLNRINPDFTAAGSEQGGTDTRLARAWAYQALGIHAVTFEGSYQDVDYGPSTGQYMTVARYLGLGEAFGRAVAESFFGIPEGGGLALHSLGCDCGRLSRDVCGVGCEH